MRGLIVFLLLTLSHMGLSQDNNVVYTKVAKRINLFMTSPLSRPMGDPSLDHMRETGFEIIIRTKFDESFHQIPHLIKKLKRRSNTNSQTSKHVIYCVLSYGVLRKRIGLSSLMIAQ